MWKLLFVTPDGVLGERCKKALLHTGNFQVTLAHTASDALVESLGIYFHVVVIDSDLSDMAAADLGEALSAWFGRIKLILLLPDANWINERISRLEPDAVLEKPFVPDDLRIAVERLFLPKHHTNTLEETPKAPEVSPIIATPTDFSNRLPTWMQDAHGAARHLARLMEGSAVQASMIMDDESLWVYVGELPQRVALELAEQVRKYWVQQGAGDMVRFIQLQSIGTELLLYATRLMENLILALIFDGRTPFSQIRRQASRLTRAMLEDGEGIRDPVLASGMVDAALEQAVVEPHLEEQPEPNLPSQDLVDEAAWGLIPNAWLPEMVSIPGRQTGVDGFVDDESSPTSLPDFSMPDLFKGEAAPSYLPFRSRERAGSKDDPPVRVIEQDVLESSPAELRQDDPGDLTQPTRLSQPDRLPQAETQPVARTVGEPPPNIGETRPIKVAADFNASDETQPTQAENTRPPEGAPFALEYAFPAMYHLRYTCVIIPRFSHHLLTGSLAAHLGEWVPQICIAFGWRLEQIAVRPTHLQWDINIPPAASPEYMIRIVRKITSQRILVAMPHLKTETLSGDFWAPGYLVVGSSDIPPHQLVQQYIREIRKRQGLA